MQCFKLKTYYITIRYVWYTFCKFLFIYSDLQHLTVSSITLLAHCIMQIYSLGVGGICVRVDASPKPSLLLTPLTHPHVCRPHHCNFHLPRAHPRHTHTRSSNGQKPGGPVRRGRMHCETHMRAFCHHARTLARTHECTCNIAHIHTPTACLTRASVRTPSPCVHHSGKCR